MKKEKRETSPFQTALVSRCSCCCFADEILQKKKKKKFIKKTGLIITYIEYHGIRQNGFFFNDEITLRVK